jgi:2',3'-cyclic-nucleotide 2'-phosphodiesterase (5'-nucleotidase family)
VIGRTRILSAGQFYDHVGRLRFAVDGPQVTFLDYALLPVDRCVRPDRWVQAQVDVLKKQIVAFYKEDVYKRVIGWALRDIRRDAPEGRPARDTAMGNLIADAYRFKTHSDVSLVAAGYIADVLYRGPVVGADVFRTVPYGIDPVSYKDYPLVVVGLKGTELWKGVETTLGYLDVTNAFFLQVSGIRYVYDSRNAPGSRLLELTVNGETVVPTEVYSVTVNYMVAMIAQNFMGLHFESFAPAGLTEYDAVRDWVKHLRVLRGRSGGRIVDVALMP